MRRGLKGRGAKGGVVAHSARVASHTITVRTTNTILGHGSGERLGLVTHPPSLAGHHFTRQCGIGGPEDRGRGTKATGQTVSMIQAWARSTNLNDAVTQQAEDIGRK